MNCKPGDLAVVVRITDPRAKKHLGRIVRVTQMLPLGGEPLWWFEPVIDEFVLAHDSSLRPIRDPGDDAQDETLQWLPVPSREKEAA